MSARSRAFVRRLALTMQARTLALMGTSSRTHMPEWKDLSSVLHSLAMLLNDTSLGLCRLYLLCRHCPAFVICDSSATRRLSSNFLSDFASHTIFLLNNIISPFLVRKKIHYTSRNFYLAEQCAIWSPDVDAVYATRMGNSSSATFDAIRSLTGSHR